MKRGCVNGRSLIPRPRRPISVHPTALYSRSPNTVSHLLFGNQSACTQSISTHSRPNMEGKTDVQDYRSQGVGHIIVGVRRLQTTKRKHLAYQEGVILARQILQTPLLNRRQSRPLKLGFSSLAKLSNLHNAPCAVLEVDPYHGIVFWPVASVVTSKR